MSAQTHAAPKPMGRQFATTELIQPGTPNVLAEHLAAAIGIELMPWQKRVLGAFTSRKDDHWAARECLLLCPRQQGKSLILSLRILAGALLLGEKEILYSAHEYTTSKSFFRDLSTLIHDNRMLERELVRSYTSNGDFRMIFRTGATLRLISRTSNSGRGLHPDLILMDESFSVSQEVLTALVPSQASRPDPQVIWASSAGDDTSLELINMRNRLHSGTDPYLTGFDWWAPLDLPANDPATWEVALPSLGTLTSLRAVQQSQSTLSPTSFAREMLGRWQEAVIAHVFTSEQIEAVLGPPLPAPDDAQKASLSFGVEVAQSGVTRTASSVVACWLDADRKPVCSVVRSQPGTDWLEGFLRYASETYHAPICYDAKSGALDIFERVTRDGEVEMIKCDWPSYSRACAGFYQAVIDRRITICKQPTSLASDMASAKQKQIGPAWCWDRTVASPPASLIAATVAFWGTEQVDSRPPMIF